MDRQGEASGNSRSWSDADGSVHALTVVGIVEEPVVGTAVRLNMRP